MRFWLPLRARPFVPPPLIHITHAKAGSTWVDAVLRALYGRQVAPRAWEIPARFSFERHRVYAAIFMTREEFRQHPELTGIHRFVVIRDLRDTLISNYFSLRDTHELDPGGLIQQRREKLRGLSVEEGLAWLIDDMMPLHAAIQRSWLDAEVPLFRYEELVANDLEIFRGLLLGTFGHQISEERLERAVTANRFESVFRRKLGEEDPTSHGRKGAPGDWRNHFTPALCAQFEERFGELLVATGYEEDARWVMSQPT